MEILGPHFFTIILFIAFTLTILSLLMLCITTVVHWRTEQHEQRLSEFDQLFEPAIQQFLNGQITTEDTLKIAQQDPDEALTLLIHLYQNLSPNERPTLAPLFAELISIEAELSALNNQSIHRRLLATERLGYLKDNRSTEALLKALKDTTPAIRLSAARSLAAHGKTEAIEPILLSLDLPDDLNELREVEAIFDFGPCATPALLNVLTAPDQQYSNNVIVVASRALGMLKATEAVPALTNLLQSAPVSVRINAAHALGEIGDPSAIPTLEQAANDQQWEVRNKAVKSLGKLQAKTKIPTLENALRDTSWWVRSSAAQSLHSFGAAGISALHHALNSSTNEDTQEICREVLAEHNILDA